MEERKEEQQDDGRLLVIGVVVALLVVLIAFLYRRGRGGRGRGVAFVGGTGAGKTCLWAKVVFGSSPSTLTSLSPNEGDLEREGKKSLKVFDLPGHPRVFQQSWAGRAGVGGAVMVVDAAGGGKAVREAAEVLFHVLTTPNGPSKLLVVANKQDLPTAKSAQIIKTLLEREMTTLRMTRAAGLLTTAGSGPKEVALGRPDKDFEFKHLQKTQVDFGESVGVGVDLDVSAVSSWLQSFT